MPPDDTQEPPVPVVFQMGNGEEHDYFAGEAEWFPLSSSSYLDFLKKSVFTSFGLPGETIGGSETTFVVAMDESLPVSQMAPLEMVPLEKAGFHSGYYKTVHTSQGPKQVYVQPGQLLHQVQQHLLTHGKSTAQHVANATEIPTHHVLQALGHLAAEGKAESHEDGAFPAYSDQGKSYSHKGEYDHPEGYIEHAEGHLLPTVAAGKLKPGTHLASGSEVMDADGSGKFTLDSGTTFPFDAGKQVPVKPEHFTHGTSPEALATAKKAHAAAKKTKSVTGVPPGGGLSDTASPGVLHQHAQLLANGGAVTHAEVEHAFGHLPAQTPQAVPATGKTGPGEAEAKAEKEKPAKKEPAPKKTEAEQKQAVLTVIQAAGATGLKESEIAGKAHVNSFTVSRIVSALFDEDQVKIFKKEGYHWVKAAAKEAPAVPAPVQAPVPVPVPEVVLAPPLSENAQEILRELQHPELEEYGHQAAGAYLFAHHSTNDPEAFTAAVEELKAVGAITVSEKPSGDLLKLVQDWPGIASPPETPAAVPEPEVTFSPEAEEVESDALEVANPKTPDGKIWVDVGDEVFAWYAPSGASYYLRESSYGEGMSLTMTPEGSSQQEFLGVFGDSQAAADYAAALEDGHAQMAVEFSEEAKPPAEPPGETAADSGWKHELEEHFKEFGGGVSAHAWKNSSGTFNYNIEYGNGAAGTFAKTAATLEEAKKLAEAQAVAHLAKTNVAPEKAPPAPETSSAPLSPSDAILALLTASPNGLSAHSLGAQVFPGEKPATAWGKANKILVVMEALGGAYKVGAKWKAGSAPGAPAPAPSLSDYQQIAQFITAHPGSTAAEIMAGTGLSKDQLHAEGAALVQDFVSHEEPGKPVIFYPKGQEPAAEAQLPVPQLDWTDHKSFFEVHSGNKIAQVYKANGGWNAAYKDETSPGTYSLWVFAGGDTNPQKFPTAEEAQLWAENAMGVAPAPSAPPVPEKQLLTAVEALGQLGGKATGMQVASQMGAYLEDASEQLEAAYLANEVHHEGSFWVLGPHTLKKKSEAVVFTPPALQPDFSQFKYPAEAEKLWHALQAQGTLTIGQAGKLAFPEATKGSQYSKPQDLLNKMVALGYAAGGVKGPYSALPTEVPEAAPEPEPAPALPAIDFSQIKYPQEAVEKIHAALQQGPLKISQAQAAGFGDPKSSYWTAAKNVLLSLKKQGLVVSDDETKKLSEQLFSLVPQAPQGEVQSPLLSGGKITKEQLASLLTPGQHYSTVQFLNAVGLPHDVTSLQVLQKLKAGGLVEQVGPNYVLPGTAQAPPVPEAVPVPAAPSVAPWKAVSDYPEDEKKILAALLLHGKLGYGQVKEKAGTNWVTSAVLPDLYENGLVVESKADDGFAYVLTPAGIEAAKQANLQATATPAAPAIGKKTAVEALASLGGEGTTGAVAGKMPATFTVAGKELQAAEFADQVHKKGSLWVLGPKPAPEPPKVYQGEAFDPHSEKSTLYHAVFDTLKAAEEAGEGPQSLQALASQLQMVSKYGYPFGTYAKQTQVAQALKHLQKMGLIQVDSSDYPPKYSLVPGKNYPWPKAKTPKAGTAQATGAAQADQVAAGVSAAGPAPTAIPEVTDVPGVTVEHLQDILSVAGKSPLALIQMTYVAPKPGGTVTGKGSGVYTAPDGEKYVVKHAFGGDPKTGAASAPPYKYWDKDPGDEHSRSEVLATKLAMACGVPVPDCKRVELGGAGFPGKWGIASEWIDVTPGKWNSPEWVEAAQDQFAIHAWLGNWDVVGAAKDNMVTGPDGQPLCIDWGGSLLFRAQGKKKWLDGEETFGPSVSEWDTFTSGSFDAVKLFGSMTAAQKIESAKRVAAISEPAIRALVDEFGPSNPGEREKLYSILCSRRKDLIKRANSEAKKEEFAALEAAKEKQDQASVQHLVSSSWKGVEASVAGASQAFKTVGKGGVKVLQGAGEAGNYHKQWGYYVHLNDPVANGELAEAKQKAHQIVQEALGLDAATFNPNQSPFYSPTGSKTHGSGHGGYQVPPPAGTNITLYDTDKSAAKVKKEIEAKLPTAAQNALKSYLGGGYSGQNTGLRTGNPASNATLARNAFHEVAHELPAGSYSERGLSLSQAVLANLRKAPGVVLQEPGFSSTSPTQPWGGNVTLCIYAAPGAKALNVKKFQSSALQGEDELLYGPDQRYLVFAVGDGKDVKGQQKTLVHVLALPPEEA